ncbi:MAG: PHP domain-containing protein [Tissierellaceae bacterium]|nr:PHP domain-containing protein [Tissierellaceae bacterium]
MQLIGDYHTHTIYSHGTGSIRDNVEAALKKGLKEVAICDHGPGHYLYGVKKKNIPIMREEIDRLNDEFGPKGIKVLLGVEANLIGYDGIIDMDDKLIKMTDLLLLGYHYGIVPHTIYDSFGMYIRNPISKVLPLGRQSLLDLTTRAFVKAINNYPIDFITHPGSKAKVDIKTLAREAGKVGTALEINSKHSQLSIESIEIALKEDVEFVINSDAHRPEDVGNVEESLRRANAANLPMKRIRNIEI